MSEYWVSHKKYFCKYCEIYIADDAPSRRQHEAGLRHKGNRERFVRGLYKQGERRKKDLEEEKREMARIEVAANASFARDVSSGNAPLASSSRSSQDSPSAASKKPEKPTSVWSNYSTAQSLGITDPDEERIQAEMERRRTQGVAGDWEVVAPPPPPLSGDVQVPKEEDSKERVLGDALPQKREAEASLEEEEDVRNFKLRKRTIGVGLGEMWDPGDIPIKLKSRPNMEGTSATMLNQCKPEDESDHIDTREVEARSLKKPEWRPTGWKRVADHSPPNEESGKTLEVKEKDKPDESNENSRQSADKSKWQSAQWKPAITSADNVPGSINEGTGKQTEPDGADLSIQKVEESLPLHSDSTPRHVQNGAHHGSNKNNSEMMLAKPNVKEEEIEAPITPQPPEGLFRKRKVPAAGRGRR